MAFPNDRVKQSDKKPPDCGSNQPNTEDGFVRILLFKETGFNDRTLIFDSSLIRPIDQGLSDIGETSSINFHRLSEMVFGSLSLKYRGTYFRIHNLSSPNRLMLSQVFPFPESKRAKGSASQLRLSGKSQSELLYMGTELDESTPESSTISLNMKIREDPHHHDICNDPNSSTSTIDSGFGGQSYKSFVISSRSSFNSNKSVNKSHNKICETESGIFSTYPNFSSADICEEYSTACSALGLVIILTISPEKAECLHDLLKYISFIQSIAFRIRQNIDSSYGILLSKMIEVSQESTQWIIRMFPDLKKCKRFGRATPSKLSRYCEEMHDDPLKLKVTSLLFKMFHPRFSVLNSIIPPKKLDSQLRRSDYIDEEKYFTEFCEVLGAFEGKETNFFVSAIVTAILTYHLGWISSCVLPLSSGSNLEHSSYNGLWKQIAELYGALGCPMKSAQTIINGTNQNGMLTKVLHFISYFVRYSAVLHNCLERVGVQRDNDTVDMICMNNKNGNYVKIFQESLHTTNNNKSLLSKSKGRLYNLSELFEDEVDEGFLPQENKVTFLLGENEELVDLKPNVDFLNSEIDELVTSTATKLLNSSIIKHSSSFSMLEDSQEDSEKEYRFTYLKNISRFSNSRSKMEWENNYENSVKTKTTENDERMPGKLLKRQIVFCDSNWLGDISEGEHCVKRPNKDFHKITKMKIFSFSLPSSRVNKTYKTSYTSSLISDTIDKYAPDVAIQGTRTPPKDWKTKLKRDLYLTRQISYFDGCTDESVAVVGNMENWDVEIISSRDNFKQNKMGMRIDISPLVVNMFEVLMQMCSLHFCHKYSATHIEQRLLEICIRSYALSQFLLHTDMCTIDQLTTTLHLEINDIPLLMSVSSVIAPEVTNRYGLSYQ